MTPAASTPSRARQALEEMGRARDTGARKEIGDRFLRTIEGDAQSTDLERTLAAAALGATRKPLYSQISAVNGQQAALGALAAGVSGPCGPLLAAIAGKTLASAYNTDDRRALAPPFLEAIAAHGTSPEQRLARVALDASSQRLYSATSAVQAQTQAFALVEKGIADPSDAAVADYGRAIMKTAYNSDDRAVVGGRVLADLAAHGSVVAGAAVQASQAKVSSRTSQVTVQEKALELVASTPDPAAAVLALGRHAVTHAYNTDDRALLGGVILGELANHSDPATATLSSAALRASNTALYTNTSRLNLQAAVYELLAAGVADPPERALAKLGLAAHTAGYNAQDKASLGAAVLDELGARTADARVRTQVSYAVQACAKDAWVGNMAAQKAAFENILSGRATVSVPLAGVGLALQMPVLAEGATDVEALAQLGPCVKANREVVASLERLASQQAAAVPVLEAELKRLEEAIAGRAGKTPEHVARTRRFEMLQTVSTGAMLAGFLGLVATHNPLCGIAAIAGTLGTIVFSQMSRKASIETARHWGDGEELKFKQLMAQTELSGAKSALAKTRAALEQAETIHGPLDERYRLLDMTRFVEATMPDPDARVELEDQFVTIGGLRVPRNTAAPAA